jgi:hypothetical protein
MSASDREKPNATGKPKTALTIPRTIQHSKNRRINANSNRLKLIFTLIDIILA